MKVRIKFAKTGHMKFIGHLDTMRYFQKAVRRAGLPAAFSEGYSPHMIMSFAIPLGVGTTSLGEYLDLELKDTVPTEEIKERLNQVMAEGISVLSVRKVEDGKAGNVMALVAACDYEVCFRHGKEPQNKKWREEISAFLKQPEILITKKTKKSEKTVDIRPFIYEMYAGEDGVFLKLDSSSANFTKPEAVLDSFLRWMNEEPIPFAYQIERREIYADKREKDSDKPVFVPMEMLGESVE